MQFVVSLIASGSTEAITPGLRCLLLRHSFQHASPVRAYFKKLRSWTNEAKDTVPDTDEQFPIHSQCIHTTHTYFSIGPEMWAYRYRSLKSLTLTLLHSHLSTIEIIGSTPTWHQVFTVKEWFCLSPYLFQDLDRKFSKNWDTEKELYLDHINSPYITNIISFSKQSEWSAVQDTLNIHLKMSDGGELQHGAIVQAGTSS